MHVTIHTSQTWADTFISELNDTHVEAELRTKHIPPQVEYSLAPCVTASCDSLQARFVTAYEPVCQGEEQRGWHCNASRSAPLSGMPCSSHGQMLMFRDDNIDIVHVGVQLDAQETVGHYTQSKRLLVLGHNLTFTA